MHEHDLPTALAADVDGSFERLVVTFQNQLYAFALRFTGQPQDAEDIVADALMRAYQALSGYTPERIQALNLRPWLYRITLNVCRNRKRGKRLPLVSLQDPVGEAVVDIADDAARRPEGMLEQSQSQQTLALCLASLPEAQRLAVLLRHVQGMRYSDIARLLEQPVGTIKANVHRGIQRLRGALARMDMGR